MPERQIGADRLRADGADQHQQPEPQHRYRQQTPSDSRRQQRRQSEGRAQRAEAAASQRSEQARGADGQPRRGPVRRKPAMHIARAQSAQVVAPPPAISTRIEESAKNAATRTSKK